VSVSKEKSGSFGHLFANVAGLGRNPNQHLAFGGESTIARDAFACGLFLTWPNRQKLRSQQANLVFERPRVWWARQVRFKWALLWPRAGQHQNRACCGWP